MTALNGWPEFEMPKQQTALFENAAREATAIVATADFVCPLCGVRAARARSARGIVFAICNNCQASCID